MDCIIVYVRVMEHGTLAVLRNNTSNHGSPGLTGHVLEKKLKEWIAAYRDDMDLQEILDWLQTEYKCCGVQGKIVVSCQMK